MTLPDSDILTPATITMDCWPFMEASSSPGRLLSVIDLQGMADPEKDRPVLTEPATHHKGLSLFYLGSNSSSAGITTFMDYPVFNSMCSTLILAFNESPKVDVLRQLRKWMFYSNCFEDGFSKTTCEWF